MEKTGGGCKSYKAGDRVFGLLPGGGYAQYAVIPETMAMPMPGHLTFEQAAAVPEVFMTAFQTLFWIGGLQAGETVLIHPGGSGVGTAAVLEYTRGKGVDLILDFVAAAYWEKNIAVLRTDGRMVLISLMGGSITERVDLGEILQKRLQINGTTLRGRSEEYKIRLTREFAAFALDKLAAGRLKPVIDCVFPWEQVEDAHARMEANRNFGKIVLTVR